MTYTSQVIKHRYSSNFRLLPAIMIFAFVAIIVTLAVDVADESDAGDQFTVDGLVYEPTSGDNVKVAGCMRSGDVTVPAYVQYDGETYYVTSVGDYAFYDNYSLTSVDLPYGIKSIGECAFKLCRFLTSVTLPDSLKSMGDKAFSDCNSLTSVDIPHDVSSIGELMFFRCASLVAINVSPGNEAYSSVDGVLFNKAKTLLIQYPAGKAADPYVVPNGVKTIGKDAFRECTEAILSVTFSNGVTTIEENAFYACLSLRTVKLSNTVTTIGKGAFNFCESLTSVTIPDSVTSIGGYAFNYNQFYDFDGVTEIKDYSDLPGYSYYGESPSKLIRHMIEGEGEDLPPNDGINIGAIAVVVIAIIIVAGAGAFFIIKKKQP